MVPIQVMCDQDYFADLVTAVKTAGNRSRIGLTTMTFDPREPHIRSLMDELIAAAKRGARVHLLVDAHSFMIDTNNTPSGPLLRGERVDMATRPEFIYKYDVLNALVAAGGHYQIINRPRSRITLPIAGRSHIKTAVINNRVYLGGCNLSHTQQIDCMVRFADKKIADWLFDLITNAAQTGNMRKALHNTDRRLHLDNHTTLLVDAGVRNQSLILTQALELIDNAEEYVIMTCQFFPNSVTARHLERARRRGVNVEVHYNHPDHHARFFSLVQRIVLLGERLRLHKELFLHQLPKNHRRIHGKIIATDKGAMVGSHNYVRLGVLLGTAEIALRRDDPAFSRDVVSSIMPHLVQ